MNNLDFTKMSEIIRTMPQYENSLKKYTMHMKLIEDCWSIFEKKDLKDIGELEQTLATGIGQDGKSPSTSKLLQQISARMDSKVLDDYDKTRLVLIAAITIEMAAKDR